MPFNDFLKINDIGIFNDINEKCKSCINQEECAQSPNVLIIKCNYKPKKRFNRKMNTQMIYN